MRFEADEGRRRGRKGSRKRRITFHPLPRLDVKQQQAYICVNKESPAQTCHTNFPSNKVSTVQSTKFRQLLGYYFITANFLLAAALRQVLYSLKFLVPGLQFSDTEDDRYFTPIKCSLGDLLPLLVLCYSCCPRRLAGAPLRSIDHAISFCLARKEAAR
ncbi:hypothetical protein E2C01_034838 [Portunus trituberculatus]|uniref:Uncharacterized protein n=1 Tax=Portunus trituberculatus TaxID=210409 RepID=A0A5B7F1L3_PORTR|nr:hypothetical protein [Portunus trituberculatus]